MHGALGGEGIADDPVTSGKGDSGTGNQQHNLSPEQFEGMFKGGKGAGAGKAAGAGEAAGGLSMEELALAA